MDQATQQAIRKLEDKAYARLFEATDFLRRAGRTEASAVIGRAVRELDAELGRPYPTYRYAVAHLESGRRR